MTHLHDDRDDFDTALVWDIYAVDMVATVSLFCRERERVVLLNARVILSEAAAESKDDKAAAA